MPRRLSCFPSADHAFCDVATQALDQIAGDVASDGVAAMLANVLRPSYPAVQVHRQELLARVFDDDVWYAYRDGKPIAAHRPL